MTYFAESCHAGFNSYTAVAAIMLVGGRLVAKLVMVKLFRRHSALNASDIIWHSPAAMP
jgi:hypothetical protein